MTTSGVTVGQVARRPRRDAVANRLRVLDAAEAVFGERGVGAGVEEVAREAGVGVATLYRGFPTKDALIAELVGRLLDRLTELAGQSLAAPDGTGLETYLEAMGAQLAEHRGCLGRLWSDAAAAERHDGYWAVLDQLLSDAQRAGRVRADATRDDLRLVFWSLRGVLAPESRMAHGWRRHVALLTAGLRPTSGPPLPD